MSTALITGASSGIGLELARIFAANGNDVVLVARREDKLKELAHELAGQHGVTAHVFAGDLSDANTPARLFEFTETEHLEIEYLANNAGFGSNGPFIEQDLAREMAMIQVNIAALAELTWRYARKMKARGRGRILNIASTAGFQPGPGMSVYFATKAFVIPFSEAVNHELRGTGVTVTAHCPGATQTGFAVTAGNDNSTLFQRGSVATSKGVAAHAYNAMQAGKPLAIHGWHNWVSAFGVRLVPRSLLTRLSAWVNAPV